MTDTMTDKVHNALAGEVNDLLAKLADLGNVSDNIATADLNEDNEDYKASYEWEQLLDSFFDIVQDFAKSKEISTE